MLAVFVTAIEGKAFTTARCTAAQQSFLLHGACAALPRAQLLWQMEGLGDIILFLFLFYF